MIAWDRWSRAITSRNALATNAPSRNFR
jgi:hypothetical protein